MLGKSQWFTRRKYGGWGLRPTTWQGWAYVALMIVPMVLINASKSLSEEHRTYMVIAWLAFVILDILDIMRNLKKDERAYMHEAVSERNAAWFMVAVLTAGFAYRLVENAKVGEFYIDPILAFALFGAVIVKGVSNYVLERKN